MITKSMVGLVLGSVFIFGNAVLSIDKLDSIECKIIKKNNKDVNCTQKGTYSLDIGDEIISSLKKNDFNISYHTTDSVFVLKIKNGYKIDKSLLSWLKSLYNNIKYPNVNDGNGGVNGYSNKRYKLPSKTKILYGDKLEININKKDITDIEECLIEDTNGTEIKIGYSCLKQKIILDSNKFKKNKKYTLFIIYGKNKQKAIDFSFVDNRDIQLMQKKNLKEQSKELNDFKLYIYQINQKEER